MGNNQKLRVFLCHSKVDKSKVRELYYNLINDGFDAWLDEEELLPGSVWELEIHKAVRASDVVIVCISNNSITKAGYVNKEIKIALDIADEKPEGTIFIIPARLEICQTPERLSKWHWVDLFDSNGYEKLRLSLDQRALLLGLSNENEDLFNHIALWGPTGSGKSWLLQAFAKELSWYNESDPDFEYVLKDFEDYPILVKRPSVFETPPTEMSEDQAWKFFRVEKRTNPLHKHRLYEHKLIVHDGRGSEMIDMVHNFSDYHQSIYYSIFRYSRTVIILLDPTNIKDSPVEMAGSWITKNDYERWIDSLIEIGLKDKSHLQIAVCLSKSDLINSFLPTEDLVAAIFGDGIIKVFNSPQVTTGFFRVSSVGTILMNGARLPNITDNMTELRDQDKWNPVNVASPFFWIFEKKEKERISKANQRIMNYKPYPQPRLLFPE